MKLTPRRGFVLLIYALVTMLSVATATDPDLWWHLRTGELILNEGIPGSDIFSFTVAGGDWVTHEWGSQAAMWVIWSIGGASSLIVVFTGLVLASFAMAQRTSTARTPTTAVMVVLGAATASPLTAPRPQVFNMVLLAGLILLLERIRRRTLGTNWLWVTIPLVIVWSNLHSGYLLGVATLAVYALGERLERRRSRGRAMPDRVISGLPVAAVGALAVAAVNPNGPAMWAYPLTTLRSSAMRTQIVEWHSPDFHSPRFWPFLLMLLVSAVSVSAGGRKPGWTQRLLLAGTAVAGLQSIRHMPLFAIVAVPIVAEQLEVAWDGARAGFRRRAWSVAPSSPVGWLTGILAVVIAGTFLSAAILNNDRVVAETYPSDAVDAILASELADARGFNHYGWGGYLIWRDLPVFIDGRADVYGDEFIYFYLQAEDAESNWRDPLDTYEVDYVLLVPDAPLGVVLAEADDWTRWYEDEIAEIFVRCTDDCPALSTQD